MKKVTVVQIGNPILRKKAKAVVFPLTKEIKKTIHELVRSMQETNLVGMAAPQIGQGIRIFVTELRETTTRNSEAKDVVRVFINPRILSYSKKKVAGYEGCGSIAYAGLFGSVQRPDGVVISAQDIQGKKFTLRAKGLLARVIQHEYDHLDGIIFLDRMKNMDTLMSREEYLGIK